MDQQSRTLLFYVLLAFIVLNLLIPGESESYSALITTVSIPVLALIYIVVFKQNRITSKTILPFALILVALFVSISASVYLHASLKSSVFLLVLVLAGWLAADLELSARHLHTFCWTISIVAGVLSVYGLTQIVTYFADKPDVEIVTGLLPVSRNYIDLVFSQKRIFSTFLLPTSFSIFLAISFPVSTGLFFHEKRWWKRIIVAAIMLLTLFALVQTKSHGGIAALLASTAVVILLMLRNRGWSWTRIGISLGLVIILSVSLILVVGLLRNNYLWDLGHTNSPIRLRAALWSAGLAILAGNFLTGIGPGNFDLGLFPYVSEVVRPTKYAHNTFLQAGIEFGVLGIILLLFLVGAIVLRVLRDTGKREAGSKSIPAGLTVATFVFLTANFIEIVAYFYSLGLLGAVLIGIVLRNKNNTEGLRPPSKMTRTLITILVILMVVPALGWFASDYLYESVKTEFQMQYVASVEGGRQIMPGKTNLEQDLQRVKLAQFFSPGDYRLAVMEAEIYSRFASVNSDSRNEYNRLERDALSRAVDLCPYQPNLRSMYVEALVKNRQVIEAGIQAIAATKLYPLKQEYKEALDLLSQVNKRMIIQPVGAGEER